jgi:hypothetical protein
VVFGQLIANRGCLDAINLADFGHYFCYAHI